MSAASQSTLAQLLFMTRPAIDFAQVVDELGSVLALYPAKERSMACQGETFAVFDLDGSRVALGFSGDLTGQHGACLTVSVGRGADDALPGPLAARRTSLCRKIAVRLSSRYAVDDVVWHETDCAVTAEFIDQLLETLPGAEPERLPQAATADIDRLLARMSVELATRQVSPVTNFARPEHDGYSPLSIRPPKARVQAPSAPPAPAAADVVAEAAAPLAANDRPALPRHQDADTARIRAALYPPEEDEADARPTTQMRLAVHALNATMIVVLLPVGAAVMTYSILKGEDLRLSGRMMTLTGLFLAASQSQMGQHLIAYI